MTQKLYNVIDRLRNESIEHLSDPAYLEFKLLPELGLNDRHMHQYPSSLHPYCGIGIDSWQYPNQFSKYLHYLSQQDITSYCEIGCHKGGTFIITVEYLSRFNKLEKCLAADNWPRDIMKEYADTRPEIEYIASSSQSPEFSQIYKSMQWDLTLIDGDHSYAGAAADYQLVKDHSKIIAFHDVKNIFCPGTQQIWQEVKQQHTLNQEWSAQYDEVLLRIRGSIMGIGLVHNNI